MPILFYLDKPITTQIFKIYLNAISVSNNRFFKPCFGQTWFVTVAKIEVLIVAILQSYLLRENFYY